MARRKSRQQAEGLDGGMLIRGLLIGLTIGAVYMLFNAPRSGAATRRRITRGLNDTSDLLRERIEEVTADPLSESIAEGKAAAQARRASLGLAGPDLPATARPS